MQNDKDNNTSLNWNYIVNQEARSVDDNADLGKIKGLFDQFIVTERGAINREKFYLPKSLIKNYDGEILYLNITEQEAKDAFMRDAPPSDEEIKYMQSITKRLVASRKDLAERLVAAAKVGNEEEVIEGEANPRKNEELVEMKQEQQLQQQEHEHQPDADHKYKNSKVTAVIKKGEELKENLAATATSATKHISMPKYREEEIIKKIKLAASEFTHIVVSGAKAAKQKIEEKQELEAEKQAQRDAEKISKMGGLATQLTNSFDNILFEIETRSYAEQEQIYKGLLKLMNQQLKLVKARRDLATKLKGSDKPVVNETRKEAEEHSIVARNKEEDQKQKQLPKEPELPMPEPQLPEINIENTTNVNNNDEQQL